MSTTPRERNEPQRAEAPGHSRGVFEPPPDQDPKLARLLHIDYDLMLGDGQDSLERLAECHKQRRMLEERHQSLCWVLAQEPEAIAS